MKLALALAMLGVLAGGGAVRAADPTADNPSWDATVKAAIAEGAVNVHGGPGKLYAVALVDGFKAAFPDIKVNFTGLSGRDAIPKILNERAAGVYGWDVYVGGTSSVMGSLKPVGALAPIKPDLILPEVLDDKNWLGGFDAGFMDLDKKYMYGFQAEVTPTVLVNWDFVNHADLKTYQDLLKPQFAGKIVWDDPRLPGAGSAAGARFIVNLGADFLKQLYSQQQIVYISNMRQNAEWVVSGRYPIGLGLGVEDLAPFREQGLGKNIAPPSEARFTHEAVATGFGTISMLTNPPHPNAAKVYLNWLLSKAGQTSWEKTGFDSRRLDIAHVAPDYLPQPGVPYVADEMEANLHNRLQAEELGKQYIKARD
ncbi:MAG TPA: extracellular solute-binding protein [Stellaceae bacterium]|jgi:iron(III) transport system substrate-binding protein